MEALNKKERISAIFRFSMWLIICVLIISLPIIITTLVPSEQQSLQAKENAGLIQEINFEKEFFAVKIQTIMDLMKKRQANEINGDNFNAELMVVVNEIKKQTEAEINWRGDMYRNIVVIAEYLITANKVMSSSSENKDKLARELDKIILEFESCGDDIADLSSKRRRDIEEGIGAVDKEFKKALKMLNNYKAEL